LLTHVQLGVHQDAQALSCKAAFQMVGAQPVLVPGVVPKQVQDFAHPFSELHEVPIDPFLQPIWDLLKGSTTL